MPDSSRWLERIGLFAGVWVLFILAVGAAYATTFTTTVPGTTITLPNDYPEAGGVAIVMVGQNGNVYYQFSDPENAFRGRNSRANRNELEGNPFTVNDAIPLDCGFSSCRDYFGGGLANVYIRFSAYDGDTQVGGFDQNDIFLLINGVNVGNWSGRTTERTNTSGTRSLGFENGFGNNSFNTGWFDSSNPVLLNSLLDSNQTVTQVFDNDPDDNFWDFQRGPRLSRPEIETVAPGYTIEKTANVPTYANVGDDIVYTYTVSNIGSVFIRNIEIEDDRIDENATPITCNKTTIEPRPNGDPRGPDQAICQVTYEVTQADLDNGAQVTNTAVANGDPDEGVLGSVSDSATVNGPPANPVLSLSKTSTLDSAGAGFGVAGSTVPYVITATNGGNVTLTDVRLTDDLIPAFSCTIARLEPGQSDSCTVDYTVTQADVDAFALSGTQLRNEANATATAARGANPSAQDEDFLDGQAANPSFAFAKTALAGTFNAVGDTLQYNFVVSNTGNVTIPTPTITDSLGIAVSCPAGDIAPGTNKTCTGSYTVDQDDLDDGKVDNSATANVTVGGTALSQTDTATVTATRSTGLTMVKRLAAASITTFDDAGQTINYEYALTNTGNVTLDAPSVTDDKATVTCTPTEIAPGATIVCTAAYTTLQNDLNTGNVTNLATASATDNGPSVTTVQSTQEQLIVPATQSPALTIDKQAPATPPAFTVGEQITYSYEVTNSGNVAITNDITVTDDKIGTFSCITAPLARGASQTCTANYTLTVADVGSGIITNTATATDGSVTSPSDSVTIVNAARPEVTIAKVALANPLASDATSVTYRFTITNTGDAQLLVGSSPIKVLDAKLPGGELDCSPVQPGTLNMTDSFTCDGTAPVTQAERDAGEVVNTAAAQFPFTSNGVTQNITSASDTETTPITENLDFTFSKEQNGPDEFLAVGDTLTYTFTFANTGDVTISGVTVSDDLIPSVNCPITNLAPNASDTCTATYDVTQADVDRGSITNTATGTATSPQGNQQTSPTSTETSTLDPAGDISTLTLEKTANRTTFAAVGDTIIYTLKVTNDGTKTLTNTTVTDPLVPAYSCSIAMLAPGQSNSLCRVSYNVTQADVDAGKIDNTGAASNADVTGPDQSSATVNGPTRSADIEMVKTSNGAYSAVGDVIRFDFRVRNTGNVTVNGVVVEDASVFTPAQTCNVGSIAPGYDQVACSLNYTVVQADLDRGFLDNNATVTGTGADGTSLNETASVRTSGPTANPSVSITKTAASATFTSASDTTNFTFSVTNDGNVTLTDLEVVDVDNNGETFRCTLADLPPAPGANTTTQCADLSPMQFTRNHNQADVDAGSYSNTATVTGESLVGGTEVTDSDAETITGPTQTLALDIDKTSSFLGTFDTVGQSISYSYLVTNRSSVTLREPITIADSVTSRTPAAAVTVTCPATPPAGIAPNGTLTCTASYAVTQEDIDNDEITNSATASVSKRINGDLTTTTATSAADTVTINADQSPAFTVDKQIASGPTTYTDIGDTLLFEYTVTNTGNQTLTSAITITDDRIGPTCAPASLPIAPGGTASCQLTWSATQAFIDAGSVTNTATASSADVPTDATDTFTAFANQEPALMMVKNQTGGNFVSGQTITYEYVITNTGNTTIDTALLTVTDNRIPAVNCPVGAGDLDPIRVVPAAQYVCTGSYVVTFEDAQLGEVTNIASVSDGTTTSPQTSETVPNTATPSLSISKAAISGANFSAVGDDIVYEFTVTNTTNSQLSFTEEIKVDDDKIGAPFTCFTPTPADTFDTGEVVTCQATYMVTQADLDAGEVLNQATATTIFAPAGTNSTVVSAPANATTAADQDEELTVTKSVTGGTANPGLGDSITYTILTENTGNQTISAVAVSDPKVTPLTCTVSDGAGGQIAAPANVVLEPNDILTCTGPYTLDQDDVDAGQVVNVATASGNDPQGDTVTDTGTNTFTALEAAGPELTVTKSVTPAPTNVGDPAYSAVDQIVTFAVEVENTGNVTVETISLADTATSTNAASPATCSVGSLAPGDKGSCTFQVVITQADIDAGSFQNTATASGTPDRGTLPPASDTITVQGPAEDPGFAMSKTANPTTASDAGDVVTYTYIVGNNGNITLFAQPVIVDDKIGTFNCGTIPAGGLAPLETLTCTATYTVTQNDADAGSVTNVARVSSTEVTTPAEATETVTINRGPALTLLKTPSITSDAEAGDVIIYTYDVTNSGNTRVFNVDVDDTQTSAAGTATLTVSGETLTTDANPTGDSTDASGNGSWDSLAPGDVVRFTSSYTVTQADVDSGNDLSNTAVVNGTGPSGTTAPSDTKTVTVPVEAADPELQAEKTVSGSTGSDAGDTVTFEIEVENIGNVTLDPPTVVDTLSRVDGTVLSLMTGPTFDSGDGGTVGEFEVGETFVYTATYRLTQADVDAGGISNQVRASSTGPNGGTTTDLSGNDTPGGGDSPTVFTITPAPSVTAVKSITSSTTAVGELVTFEIEVTNDGNVTLTSVAANDTLTRANGDALTLTSGPDFRSSTNGSPQGTLIPNEVATYVASYRLVQDDIDEGGVNNTATISANPPAGPAVSDVTDSNNPADGAGDDDPTKLVIAAAPALNLAKTLNAASDVSFDAVGDVIDFDFTITNAGNVTLAGPFTVSDALIEGQGGAVTCPAAAPLAPAATVVCTGSYTVTQDDLNAGGFTNAATATDGTTTSAEDTIFVPAVQNPSMSVAKVADPIAPADFDVDAEVDYTYTVTNDGNVTLTDAITIDDNLITTVTCAALPTGGLLPGDTLDCTGTYKVTADDVRVGEVTNLAKSTSGGVDSPLTSETIPDNTTPSLAVTKTAPTGATYSEVGDVINYTFEVVNNGTRAFVNEVRIFDDKINDTTGLVCFAPSGGNPSFSVGETASCTFPYTVTQDDLDAGEVTNEAFAQTTFGASNMEVSSAPVSETVNADVRPDMSLTKTSAPNPAGPVGSTVVYSLVATNTGNQTLNTVAITDARLPGLSCSVATLARGDTLSCSENYTVTQADIDAGGITNTAGVTAQDPSGNSVGGPGQEIEATETTGVPAAAPGVSVAKTASPSPFGGVGSVVTYAFSVQNTGNTTLQNVSVDDVLDTGAACVIPRLAPGATDGVTCSFMLPVTQAMVDAGDVTNRVDVTATDLLGNTVTATDTLTLTGPARAPALETTKVSSTTGQAVGDTVTYLLRVENTGNVTLTPTGITDTMIRLDGTPTSLSTPFQLDSGDTNSDGLIGVNEAFIYRATYVITQSDVNAGGVTNTATANADGPAGSGSASDVSDDGDDSDGNSADDPTVFNITSNPQITTVKAVSGTPGRLAGETVTWTITARNTGNVDIDSVSVTDTLTRSNGVVISSVPAPVNTSGTTNLPVGSQIDWTLTYTLTQDDIDAGGLDNSATVNGTAPNGDAVQDISADSDPFDGNTESDATSLTITAAPSITSLKTISTTGAAAGDVVAFEVTVENDGNVTLNTVAITDTLSRADGTALTPDSVRFVSASRGSSEGTLLVGETATYEVLYTLQLEDANAGGISNSVLASGRTPLGGSVVDVSDDGDTTNGNDNPTVLSIAPTPTNTVLKTASDPRVLFPTVYQVTFTITVENTGNVTQSGYQVSDDLSGFINTATLLSGPPFGLAVRTSGFTGGGINAAYDGTTIITTLTGSPSLQPAETGTVEIDVTYQVDPGTTTADNVARVQSDEAPTLQDSNTVGAPVLDTDGDGIPNGLEGCTPLASNDRDGDGICDAEDFDPTGYFYCEDDGRILSGGRISVSGPAGTQTGVGFSNNIRIVQDGTTGQFVFFVTRPGTYTLNATYPPTGQASTTRLTSGNIDATSLLPANPASLGGSEVGNTNRLNDFTAAGNPFFTSFTFEAGDPFIINSNLPIENCASTPDIFVTKTVDRESAVFGETVNFTLAFTNNTSNAVTNVNLVDQLPAGLLYTPGSGVVDGVTTEPTVVGLRLTWGGITVAPAQTVQVTLAARVVANGSYGELVNRAFMTDAAGTQLSNTATATVRIEPEHVFDCSDIIGKVYDDKNQNGYQDQGEPGLPGVRLATVKGELITTDEHGRYHIPCAELPKSIGSNFTLKLDTRTLPSGYRVTTENPRVIRVTAGKFAKLNFGASLSNVIDIDLTARAFADSADTPVAGLHGAIDRLISNISETPSLLRLSYILQGEDPKLARARLIAVEALIRKKWRGTGRYKLNVERTVKRISEGAGQ